MAIKFYAGHKEKYFKYNNDFGTFHEFDNLIIHDEPHKVLVFLPYCYNQKRAEGYPVVYMNDGNTAFEPGGLSPWSWEVDKTVFSLINENLIEPVIVVVVFPKDRAKEYIDVKRFIDPTSHVLFKGGGISEYSKFMAEELKPFIDEIYNTIPEPGKTMIIGSSFGGIASFHTACMYPDDFGIAGALSPSFEIYANKKGDVRKISFERDVEKSLKKNKDIKPRLWLDWGKLEPLSPELIPEVILILKDNFGYVIDEDLFYMEDPMGKHDERAWAYRLRLILEKFYSK